MDAPPAPKVPQRDLTTVLLAAIYHRVPCFVSRRYMTKVFGSSLRKAVAPPRPVAPQGPVELPSPFPWVLLARPGGPRFSCAILGCDTHQFRVPIDARAARFLGSFDGGWLFFALGESHGHALHNLRTDQRFRLPDSALVRSVDARLGSVDLVLRDIVMLAATLSAPPDQDKKPCFAAAISCCRSIDEPVLAFWKMGSQVAVAESVPFGCRADDVICHFGLFHVLISNEEIMGYQVEIDGDDQLDVYSFMLHANPLGGASGERNVRARYLVETITGGLLMVVRFARDDSFDSPSSSFRVFKIGSGTDDDSGLPYCTWEEMHTLNGQILFVGRCCSRAYEVAKYPGFVEGIYFIDDNRFYDMSWYDEPIMPADDPPREYPCADNGKCLVPDPRIDSFLPHQDPSKYSPPVWLLP